MWRAAVPVLRTGLWSRVLVLAVLAGVSGRGRAVSEPGKWILSLDSEVLQTQNLFLFPKTLFNNTFIYIKPLTDPCSTSGEDVVFNVSWYLRSSRCYDEVFTMNPAAAREYFGSGQVKPGGGAGAFIFHQYPLVTCSKLPREFSTDMLALPTPLKGSTAEPNTEQSSGRMRREVEHPKPKGPSAESDPLVKSGLSPQTVYKQGAVAQSWDEGPYILILNIKEMQRNRADSRSTWSMQLQVSMDGPHRFISASERPLMLFYMAMCIVHVLLAVLWLALSACYWRELLRIQFWIGGVVLLDMLEKAVYYAEFQSLQYEGHSVQGAVVFAEVLSAVKRTLARVLVIIASLGYGIVKPRLGALLHRVVSVGLLYLIFSVVEGILRVSTDRGDKTKIRLLCDVVLALTDTCMAWWIFVSLAQTIKLLKLRRNLVKMSLYRHFTNTLVIAVIASVIFIIWTTKTFKMSRCLSDWRELWIDDAFWRFLFSIILLVIMFLWRPSANNQRYAFSPLVDEESDEEEKETMMNEAFEGMKMRGGKVETNGSTKPSRVDEDLRWVEENIPSSLADVALPPLLDSDEETKTTQFEFSKME